MGHREPQADHEEAQLTTGWRLTSTATASGFAWDVQRLRLLHDGTESGGALSASGDAGADFGVENTTRDDDRVWGGRPDSANRFHITIEAESGDLCIDQIAIDQPSRHFAHAVTLERRTGDGEWHPWRRFDGLQRGRNDLYLCGRANPVQHPAPGRSDRTPSQDAAERRSRVEFGQFDDRRILVSIAAYRDPELPNTIANAIAQAAYPEHLRFAICHQFDDRTAELLEPWADDPRFTVDAVSHLESRGCCWARNRCFAMFDDEPYLLQIDAHTRFAARWDVRFIDMLESTQAELPILTTYPSRYTIDDDGEVVYDTTAGIQQLYVAEVRPDLTTLQRTSVPLDLSHPSPSPTLAAGLIFTRGRFCRDVDYDPDMYFAGEEISLAARAFTSGYDLYSPNETLVWHLYHHDHPKHWEDHPSHSDAHAASIARLHTLFQGDASSLGRHGLGSVRSLQEFEAVAGIDLGASAADVDGALTLTIDRSIIQPRDDYAVFVVVLLDADGNEVQRHEVHAPDVLDLSRATVRLADTPSSAERYVVLAITRAGSVGEMSVRPIRSARSHSPTGLMANK